MTTTPLVERYRKALRTNDTRWDETVLTLGSESFTLGELRLVADEFRSMELSGASEKRMGELEVERRDRLVEAMMQTRSRMFKVKALVLAALKSGSETVSTPELQTAL